MAGEGCGGGGGGGWFGREWLIEFAVWKDGFVELE